MQFGRKTGFLFLFVIFSILSLSAAGQYRQGSGGDIKRGAYLYEAWDLRVRANLLGNTNPMWTEIGRKSEVGPVTWRCVSCHGWDYLGSEAETEGGIAVPGLIGARSMDQEELTKWLDGTMNPKHDFSEYLPNAAKRDLLEFLQHGVMNFSSYIRSGVFKIGNISSNGETLYKESCRDCHGSDGSRINFGTADNPIFLGNIAEEPWRVVHLIRFGHFHIGNTSSEELGWSFQDIIDVVIYTRALPKSQDSDGESMPDGAIDYSTQAETLHLVYASIVIALIVVFAVVYTKIRDRKNIGRLH